MDRTPERVSLPPQAALRPRDVFLGAPCRRDQQQDSRQPLRVLGPATLPREIVESRAVLCNPVLIVVRRDPPQAMPDLLPASVQRFCQATPTILFLPLSIRTGAIPAQATADLVPASTKRLRQPPLTGTKFPGFLPFSLLIGQCSLRLEKVVSKDRSDGENCGTCGGDGQFEALSPILDDSSTPLIDSWTGTA